MTVKPIALWPYTRYRHPHWKGISSTDSPTQVKQEFKAECDINTLMRKYVNTGTLPTPWSHPPTAQFGDFSHGLDFQACQEVVLAARAQFDRMPSGVRSRFNHDPAQMMRFLDDPSNRAEGALLGLLKPEATPPAPLPVASPLAPLPAPKPAV